MQWARYAAAPKEQKHICQECVAEAQAQRRGLASVPSLPCPIHGLPYLLPENELAWDIYQRMSQHRQFTIRERQRKKIIYRQVFLNYEIIRFLFDLYVPQPEQPDTLEKLHLIHSTLYPMTDDV